MNKYTATVCLLFALLGAVFGSRYGRTDLRFGRQRGGFTGSGNVVGAHGKWGSFGEWSVCDKVCGGGFQTRSRVCHRPLVTLFGTGDCIGSGLERRSCNTNACSVDGRWSSWGSYSSCSAQCGGGSQIRYRSCTNPAPAFGGAQCLGSTDHRISCNTHQCRVHGVWSAWGSYGDCSAICGAGQRTRYRTCTNPAPAYNGDDCDGDNRHRISCTGSQCLVNGGWSFWSGWSSCSGNCGAGTRTRTRSCNSPAPAYGGTQCGSHVSQSDICHHANVCVKPHQGGRRY